MVYYVQIIFNNSEVKLEECHCVNKWCSLEIIKDYHSGIKVDWLKTDGPQIKATSVWDVKISLRVESFCYSNIFYEVIYIRNLILLAYY